MIIACPACHTRYVVPDTAIGIEGRTVRCAKCKHSWFQDGPDADRIAASAPVAEPATQAPAVTPRPPRPPSAGEAPRRVSPTSQAGTQQPQPAQPARPAAPQVNYGSDFVAAPRPAPDAETALPARSQRADGPDFDETDPPYGEVQADLPGAPRPEADDDGISRFDHAPPFRPRRNINRIWTVAAAAFALLALGAVGAVQYFGLPEWLPVARPLFGTGDPDLKLEFPVEEQSRQTLPDGTEVFGATIKVTNQSRESRPIQNIVVVLRDQRERQVYSWVVRPPQDTLAPGETVSINESETGIPKSAVFADIGWAPR